MGFFSFLSKRRRQMQETATHLGMDYHYKDEYGLRSLLKEFHLFRKGHGRAITNIISHKRDLSKPDIRVFDYKFVIDKAVFKQTVFYIHSKELELPELLIKPEYFFHRIGEFFGMQDINFEAFPQFSDQYLVQGPEEDLVRNTLNDDVLHHFTLEKKWSLEGLNYLLIFYQTGKRVPASKIEYFYKHGMEVYEMLTKR